LEDADLPEVVVEVSDPLFEQLVAAGKATRLNTFEPSSKAMYQRGGMRRVVINRVKYKVVDAQGRNCHRDCAGSARAHSALHSVNHARLGVLHVEARLDKSQRA
jgi:hypothetical protein